MRFTLDQTLPAGVGDVLDAFTDPGFLASLVELPELGSPELLDQQREGNLVRQQVRYLFRGELSSAVRRVLDPNRLTWVDERTYDLSAATATFRIVPDHYAGKLRCEGTEVFVAVPGADDRTRRHIDGELTVRYPVVGGKVERAIVSGLQEHLAEEAAVLGAWLGKG